MKGKGLSRIDNTLILWKPIVNKKKIKNFYSNTIFFLFIKLKK